MLSFFVYLFFVLFYNMIDMKEVLQIVFQVLSVIMGVLAILQKIKWKMLLIYTIDNLFLLGVYFSFGRTVSGAICIVAAVRTFTYMFFAIKNLKPNIYILIAFELAFTIVTIFTYQDSLDLLALFAMFVVGYTTWQDNDWIIRIGYLINPTLWLIYDLLIGAWIEPVHQVIFLISAVVSLIYYCILKKETPILELIFKPKKKEAPKEPPEKSV